MKRSRAVSVCVCVLKSSCETSACEPVSRWSSDTSLDTAIVSRPLRARNEVNSRPNHSCVFHGIALPGGCYYPSCAFAGMDPQPPAGPHQVRWRSRLMHALPLARAALARHRRRPIPAGPAGPRRPVVKASGGGVPRAGERRGSAGVARSRSASYAAMPCGWSDVRTEAGNNVLAEKSMQMR